MINLQNKSVHYIQIERSWWHCWKKTKGIDHAVEISVYYNGVRSNEADTFVLELYLEIGKKYYFQGQK